MQITNTNYYSNLPFEQYLELGGYSYSSFKDAPPPTANKGLSLGKRVHQYLLEPSEYDYNDLLQVKEIATAIRQRIGSALMLMQRELSFTSDFEFNGFKLPYRGRADLIIPGKIVIDLKVLSGGLQPAIERFGYEHQISGYCLATGSQYGLIIAYNKAKKKTEHQIITPNADFWKYKCVQYGQPVIVTG